MKRKLKLTKAEYDALTEVQRADYVEQGDIYVLDVEGLPDTGNLERTLKKLRDREKEQDDKLKLFEGIDPAEYTRLKEAAEKAERDKALKGASDEERLAILLKPERDRYDSDRKAWGVERDKLVASRDAALGDYKSFRIRSELRSAGTTAKIKAEYHDDLELRADLFDLIDGQVVAMEMLDGEKVPRRSPKDAMKHMNPLEFIETDIAKAKPGWFEPSAGGGAGGGGRPTSRAGMVARGDTAGILANVEKLADGSVTLG